MAPEVEYAVGDYVELLYRDGTWRVALVKDVQGLSEITLVALPGEPHLVEGPGTYFRVGRKLSLLEIIAVESR